MFLVTDVRWSVALVINPAMEAVLKQRPAQQPGAVHESHAEDAGAQHERFIKQKEKYSQRIGEKAEPVVATASRQTDQEALLFSVLVSRHCRFFGLSARHSIKRSLPFAPKDNCNVP